ncbi:MAG TPA: type II 3-dehydroquinate dehydratase [Actinomycetota bacterium]|nr:type II 3-dehydroquinate dehydratase [Actinomycetota bacterium]
MNILFLFGPNLGALGRRDPAVYGAATLDQIVTEIEAHATRLGHSVRCHQSDHEGVLVEQLLAAAADGVDAVVLNAGALTHSSYVLRDAIEACGLPVVEVHMSNVAAREAFRHTSVLAGVCRGSIVGFGVGSYHLALEAMPWITN